MAKFYLLCFSLLFGFFPATAGEQFQMNEDESVLPICIVDKLVLVEASVDGRQGYFLFDTGIGGLTLNGRYFGDDYNLGRFRKVTDVNGSRARVEGCFIGQFQWGGLQRDSFYTSLVQMDELERVLDCQLFGLIGWEVFESVEVMIDFSEQFMTLRRLDASGNPVTPARGSAAAHVMPFRMVNHLPVLKARIGDCELDLGFDTGASINMLDRRKRRELPSSSRRLMRIAFGGVLSTSHAPFIAVEAICVGEQFWLTGWRMAAANMQHFERKGMPIDGLIGADLLRLGKVALNYQKTELSVWVDKSIFSQRYRLLNSELMAKPQAVGASTERKK